jgi:hypothetical protein
VSSTISVSTVALAELSFEDGGPGSEDGGPGSVVVRGLRHGGGIRLPAGWLGPEFGNRPASRCKVGRDLCCGGALAELGHLALCRARIQVLVGDL